MKMYVINNDIFYVLEFKNLMQKIISYLFMHLLSQKWCPEFHKQFSQFIYLVSYLYYFFSLVKKKKYLGTNSSEKPLRSQYLLYIFLNQLNLTFLKKNLTLRDNFIELEQNS